MDKQDRVLVALRPLHLSAVLAQIRRMDMNKRPRNERNERKPSIRLKMTGVDAWFPRTDSHLLRHTGDSGKRLPSSSSDDSTHLKPRRASTSGSATFIAPLQVASRRLPVRAKWLLAFYCCLCVCFLSGQLLFKFFLDPRATAVSLRPAKTTQEVSPLQSLPMDHLLSKITSIYPHPLDVNPFILRADVDASSVTACLWTEAEHLDSIPVWASRWKGPISALITTTVPPGSPDSQELVKQLTAVGRATSTRHKLSAHILYLKPGTTQNPNAFLNLARLFAQTPKVALFPGNLSVVPPKTFQRSIASSSSFSANKPVIFAMRGRSSFPFSPFSPILMHRDDPVWCTERFFTGLSRSADWAECVWQVWLESFGAVDARATTDWVDEVRPSYNATAVEAKVHRRLSNKFRSETCILATRQAAASRALEPGSETRKTRWLKRNCRTWMSGRDA